MIDIFLAGGPIMYPLLVCSIIALAVIVDRTIAWIYHGQIDRKLSVKELLRQVESNDRTDSNDSRPSVVLRVLSVGMARRNDGSSWAMLQAAADEVTRMEKHLGILSTMVSFTPLMGIFGTVLGIIESFQLMGDTTLADPAAATGGLAQALITTAFGLAIAMPSLIAFKVFDSKTVRLRSELEARCTELESCLGLAAKDASA